MQDKFITIETYKDILKKVSVDEKREKIIKIDKQNKEYYHNKLQELRKYSLMEPKPVAKETGCKTNTECNEEQEVIDISYYDSLLSHANTEDEMEKVLPKRHNPDFQVIMNLLILKYIREIGEIENFLVLEKNNLTKKDYDDFLKENFEKRKMIEYLKKYRDKVVFSKEETEMEEKTNKIIFLESLSGNCCALSDMKKIDISYYDSFLELLLSIKNNTFKNIKYFSGCEKLSGLLEVKNPGTRIVFQRLKGGIYVILAIFIKKVDNDLYYRENLQNRMVLYNNSEDWLLEKIADEKYLSEQAEIEKSLIRKLSKGES